MVAFFPPIFPVCAVTALLLFLCALGPSWMKMGEGTHLTLGLQGGYLLPLASVPFCSDPHPFPSCVRAQFSVRANSCQHVIQQKLRGFVGSPESVKGPIKCTQQLSWSDRLKTGRSSANHQGTQLLGVWPLQISLGSHRLPRMERSAGTAQPCSVD